MQLNALYPGRLTDLFPMLRHTFCFLVQCAMQILTALYSLDFYIIYGKFRVFHEKFRVFYGKFKVFYVQELIFAHIKGQGMCLHIVLPLPTNTTIKL